MSVGLHQDEPVHVTNWRVSSVGIRVREANQGRTYTDYLNKSANINRSFHRHPQCPQYLVCVNACSLAEQLANGEPAAILAN